MATKSKTTKSKPKEQPSKKRLPASAVASKTSAKSAKAPALSKRTSRAKSGKAKNKTAAKRSVVQKKRTAATSKKSQSKAKNAKPAASAAKKRKSQSATSSKRTSVKAKPRQKQLFSLPLGRGAKLIISVNVTKPASASKKRRSSAKAKSPAKTLLTSVSKKKDAFVACFLIISGLTGLAYFTKQAIMPASGPLVSSSYPEKKVEAPPVKPSLPPAVPSQLRIPAIQLETPLTSVGLQPDGTLEVPQQYTLAGWYKMSPTPGEIGPSVMVGHYDNAQGTTVFGRLRELIPGQHIEVVREDNQTVKFAVERVEQYSQDNFPTQQVYGNTDTASLRIITCGGNYNYLTQRYSHNTVVYASYVSEPPSVVYHTGSFVF